MIKMNICISSTLGGKEIPRSSWEKYSPLHVCCVLLCPPALNVRPILSKVSLYVRLLFKQTITVCAPIRIWLRNNVGVKDIIFRIQAAWRLQFYLMYHCIKDSATYMYVNAPLVSLQILAVLWMQIESMYLHFTRMGSETHTIQSCISSNQQN